MTKSDNDISSQIDYTTDTSETDNNIINENSEIKKIYRKVTKHKVVNTKYDSSTESVKKYINDSSFELVNINNSTTFYDMERLSSEDFNFTQLYNLLLISTYIIFIDNDKLVKTKKVWYKRLFGLFRKSSHLTDTEFPGCTFLPFESITMIKNNLNKLNNSVFNAELNGTSLYINDMICYGIMFNEGEIIKNCLYKKMEITDTIMFIPIEIYNLKQTEYKLRGFCQIVEELGAKNIEITFKNTDIVESKKENNVKLGDDIEIIAGNLGLSSSNTNVNSTNYSYDLTYPNNSTILLNEKMIRNKIKKKKFIVSDSIFKSTLELQYLVHSRCRHLIDKYSTVFTFDNNSVIDKSMYMKLKSHGITLGANIKNSINTKNNIQIITKVKFISLNECTNLISGNNVSLDEVGFNHMIETIRLSNICAKRMSVNIIDNTIEQINFETNGIYKIMNFINMYIHNVLKYYNSKYYNDIRKVLNKIKKELSITDYAKLLCNYFSPSSQWIHFTNFIDLLSKKAQSYDKLGYIIMMHNIESINRLDSVIKFIQQVCINTPGLEENFWKMLQPHNKSLRYDLENKLIIEYDFSNNQNWYNMNMLIHCIKTYNVHFSTDNDEKLKQLMYNMEVGYKYWEYYTNVLPFISQYAKSLYYNTPDEIYISTMFEKSLNIDSFMVSKINNISDLKKFIEKKISRIKEANEIINGISFRIDIQELGRIFEKNNYFNKKMQSIMKTRTVLNIKKMLENELTDSMISEVIANKFVDKMLIYNEKIDIKKIPKNYIGYEMLMDNYNNGIKEYEFKKIVLPFLCSHYKDIEEVDYIKSHLTITDFNIFNTSYYEIIQFINKMLENINV